MKDSLVGSYGTRYPVVFEYHYCCLGELRGGNSIFGKPLVKGAMPDFYLLAIIRHVKNSLNALASVLFWI